jgi:uncharacterized repeat protein (TIGR01451 family)
LDISFTINYTNSGKNCSISPKKQSYRRANLAKQFIESYVKNVDDVERFKNNEVEIIPESSNLDKIVSNNGLKTTSAIEELIPDYVIITNDELESTFQILADWKTRKGIPAIIMKVEDIEHTYPGSDLPEKIRNYLKDIFSRWGADLFILLGGDVNIIPPRMVLGGHGLMRPTDLYYTTVDGTWNANNNNLFMEFSVDTVDYGRDFYLGRASVEDAQEATSFVEKIIKYEKASEISDLSYYNNILISDAFIARNVCNTRYVEAHSDLKAVLNNYVANNINGWLMYDNFDCSVGPYAYPPLVKDYCNPDQPTLKYYVPGGSCTSGHEEFNANNFLSSLNNGGSSGLDHFHIIYHMDHSGEAGIGTSSKDKNEHIDLGDFDDLSNTNYYQIFMTSGCKPATFTKDCMGERYINNPAGGGVAFIGNSDDGSSGEWTQFRGFVNSIYETPGHPSAGRYDLGCAFQSAIGRSSNNWRLTLLGDPEMQIWTNTPQTLSVSVSPTTVVSGENTIIVTINNLPSGESATICLLKGDEGYAKQTVSTNGSYYFSFTPHTSGQIDVTVTAHNFKPFESTINVNTNQNQNIYISDLIFDDDKTGSSNGNNDLQIDAGETIELTVDLKNNGELGATNVSATLTCSSPYVSIISNSADYGNINSGSTVSSLTKYLFVIDEEAPEILVNELNKVKFSLLITDGASNTYMDVFNIDIFNPDLKQGNKTIVTTTDGDTEIEPNETVTINIDLFNCGRAQATNITGILSGNCPFITSCSSTPRNYPAISENGTETNTSVYQFTVSSSYRDEDLDFILQVENEYGKTWSFSFNLLDKPPKVNFSSIDFTADKTEIELFWDNLTDIQGYNIYRSDADANGNEVGNYVKLNTFISQAAFHRDYYLNELTKYYYKISTVSLTGNEGDLSDPKLAWTSYSHKGLFPIKMDVGFRIESSINVADINNDNLFEIFTTIKVDEQNGYIIGLNHDGTELYDIDGNVTTYSGFVHVDGNIDSNLGIGDLNGDGEFEVLSATRDKDLQASNYFYAHSVNDDDLDNQPDLLWQKSAPSRSFRGPVISNIDNSLDGSMEAVFFCEWGTINVYDYSGQLLVSISTSGSFGAPAVSDIDDDGDKEIIVGNDYGICIWHHDGTNYGLSQPYYTLSGYNLRSSVIVCDIDNDGDKEIMTSALKDGATEGRIVAIHHNGTVVSGWNGSQTIAYPNDNISQDISVGDLDNDYYLEVVAIGTNIVKVWNNAGTLISSSTVNSLSPGKLTPILADVDNDEELEIIFGSETKGEIHAVNMDGSKVLGFPLQIEDPMKASLCVIDVDNNGKNEIIAGSGTKLYMWETLGSSNLVEWRSERRNNLNAGENYVCPPTIINSNTTWSRIVELCGDLIINSGKLTLSRCRLIMSDNTKIIIKSGGILEVDESTINNANVDALSGSNIILKNNGLIDISNFGQFKVDTGATLDFQYGTVTQ